MAGAMMSAEAFQRMKGFAGRQCLQGFLDFVHSEAGEFATAWLHGLNCARVSQYRSS